MNRFRKVTAFILMLSILTCCIPQASLAEGSEQPEAEITRQLAESLGSGYVVEVATQYLSAEYIEELQFNSRQTNWFGYYLDDIDRQLEGKRYIFTIGEDGETGIRLFEAYDDSYDIAIRNLAIGTGVILVCVTVSVASGGLGAPAVSAIFAAAAKTAARNALTSGALSAIVSGVTTAVQTNGDMDATLRAAAKAGSTSYMFGAISGAAIGGASEAITIHAGTASGLTMNQVAQIRNETGWSESTISQIKSMDEYDIYREAGLREITINDRVVLMRDIDLEYESVYDDEIITNLRRMELGMPPLDPATGLPLHLHHVNQEVDGILAVLTRAEHLGNPSVLNTSGKESVQALLEGIWDKQRERIWMSFAESLGGVA